MRRIRISVFRRSASFIYFLACRKFCLAEHDRDGSRIHRRRLPAKISVLTFVLGNGLAKLGRGCVAGTRALAPSAPAKRGRGTTGARVASEPWWRGRWTRSFVVGAENSSARRSGRAKMFGHHENSCGALSPAPPPPPCFAVWSPSPAVAVADELRRVEACAPSTTPSGWSPSPAIAGAENNHIFSKRFALPLRILALSSSESGTVCIHSSAGGFMTNGQSTANRI